MKTQTHYADESDPADGPLYAAAALPRVIDATGENGGFDPERLREGWSKVMCDGGNGRTDLAWHCHKHVMSGIMGVMYRHQPIVNMYADPDRPTMMGRPFKFHDCMPPEPTPGATCLMFGRIETVEEIPLWPGGQRTVATEAGPLVGFKLTRP